MCPAKENSAASPRLAIPVVPKENNGVLVRINGVSGALFGDTFMKYQVSEQTRLRQITAEIFVSKGLDAALNIDRESLISPTRIMCC